MENTANESRRGRPALEGDALYIPVLKSIIEGTKDSTISLHYLKKVAERGYIGLVSWSGGKRGRPELKPVITLRGIQYYQKATAKAKVKKTNRQSVSKIRAA